MLQKEISNVVKVLLFVKKRLTWNRSDVQTESLRGVLKQQVNDHPVGETAVKKASLSLMITDIDSVSDLKQTQRA